MSSPSQCYEQDFANPDLWLLRARQLLEAGAVLIESLELPESDTPTEQMSFRDVGCLNGALLLLGLAIENALKAVIVAEDPPQLKDGKMKPPGGGSGHTLLALADRLEFTLSADERQSLTKIEAYVVWLGKYHVPLNSASHTKAERGDYYHLLLPTDQRLANDLVDRAEAAAARIAAKRSRGDA